MCYLPPFLEVYYFSSVFFSGKDFCNLLPYESTLVSVRVRVWVRFSVVVRIIYAWLWFVTY